MPELEDEKWLTDLAFLVDLTIHLNELSRHLQGENQLIRAVFQLICALASRNKFKYRTSFVFVALSFFFYVLIRNTFLKRILITYIYKLLYIFYMQAKTIPLHSCGPGKAKGWTPML